MSQRSPPLRKDTNEAGSHNIRPKDPGRGPHSRTLTPTTPQKDFFLPDTTLSTTQTLPTVTTTLCAFPSRLRLVDNVSITDTTSTPAMVELEAPNTWYQRGCRCVVVGDTKFTPPEITIIPGVLPTLKNQFSITIICVHPPVTLEKGQAIAQAIPVFPAERKQCEPDFNSLPPLFEVFWSQTLGQEKPRLTCQISRNGQSTRVNGMLDTGADVTIIPAREWPSQWELQNAAGRIQGVGGFQLAKQSKSVVQIMGPNGQLASVRPFVLDYTEPLWGRDVLAQWGAKIDLPSAPQVFQ